MNNTNLSNLRNLPPLPPPGATGPQVCETFRLYLAVIQDLPAEVVETLYAHLRTCPGCAEEWRLLNQSTRLIGGLAQSAPSPRVDQAVLLAAQRVRSGRQVILKVGSPLPLKAVPNSQPVRPLKPRRRASIRLVGTLVAAAALILALFPLLHFLLIPASGGQAFALPPNLSWNGYVLYHTETAMGSNGMPYRVETYHDLGTGRVHVETVLDSTLDVVAVGDSTSMLGIDILHHVAQWGADAWGADDSSFTLATLRSDIQAQRDTYLGKGSFQGQAVYRIRCGPGHVLLLDMDYMPVNMLQGTSGQPMYNTFKLLHVAQVSGSMWDMRVPQGFTMGTLPQRP